MISSLRIAAMAAATLGLAIPAIALSAFDGGGRRSSAVVRLWARAVLRLAGVQVAVRGGENLAEGPQVYVCSHQSMLDVPALLSVVPPMTRFVAKRELFAIPLFGRAIRMLGFVPVDREDRRAAARSLDAAAELVRARRPVLVFPEGTRSVDGQMLPFKKGAFALAQRLQVPLVPMVCLGGGRCMPADRLHVEPGRMEIRVGQALRPDGADHASRRSLLETARAEMERLQRLP